jgi:hypothetical protein
LRRPLSVVDPTRADAAIVSRPCRRELRPDILNDQEVKVSTTQREGLESAAPVQQVQEKLGEGVDQVKSSTENLIRSQVDERSTQLGEQLHGAVQALRRAAETMKDEGTPGTQLVDRTANQVERSARYLSESDGKRLLNDLEGIGRRNPWGVMIGGLAAGFLAARFLKASSSKRFQEYRRSYYPDLESPPAQLSAGSMNAERGFGT